MWPRFIETILTVFKGIYRYLPNKGQLQQKGEKYQCVLFILYHTLYNNQEGKGAMS